MIPALVVYERDGGLTDADLARIDAGIADFGTVVGVLPDDSSPAIVSDDGEAAETVMILVLAATFVALGVLPILFIGRVLWWPSRLSCGIHTGAPQPAHAPEPLVSSAAGN